MIGTPLSELLDPNRPAVASLSSGLYMAEYRDSVASAEGFVPKQFHSTRDKRATTKQDSREYMDTDDLYNYEVSTRLVPKDLKLAKPVVGYFGSKPINPTGLKVLRNLGWNPSKKTIGTFDYGKRPSTEPSRSMDRGFIGGDTVGYHGLGYEVDLPPLISESQRVEEKPVSKKRKAVLDLNYEDYGHDEEDNDSDTVGSVLLKRSKLKLTSDITPKFKSKKKLQANKSKGIVVSAFKIRDRLISGGPPLPGFVISTLQLCKSVEYPKIAVPEGYYARRMVKLEHVIKSEPGTEIKMEHEDHQETYFPGREGDISKDMALDALNNPNLPYKDDTEKQERYLKFLRQKAGVKEEIKEEIKEELKYDPRRMYEYAANMLDEQYEFGKVARVFKPLSNEMAKKFVSEKWTSQPIKNESLNVANVSQMKPEQAARAGLYGEKTRITSNWLPSRLLSKRLGLKAIVTEKQIQGINE